MKRKLRIYLAARYIRFPEMQTVATDLRDLGHEVTSRWIRGDHNLSGMEDPETVARKRRGWALEDLADLESAEWCISFTEPEGAIAGRGRGGRHVEFGFALAYKKQLLIIGHQENVFHNLPEVAFFPSWEQACAFIAAWTAGQDIGEQLFRSLEGTRP